MEEVGGNVDLISKISNKIQNKETTTSFKEVSLEDLGINEPQEEKEEIIEEVYTETDDGEEEYNSDDEFNSSLLEDLSFLEEEDDESDEFASMEWEVDTEPDTEFEAAIRKLLG